MIRPEKIKKPKETQTRQQRKQKMRKKQKIQRLQGQLRKNHSTKPWPDALNKYLNRAMVWYVFLAVLITPDILTLLVLCKLKKLTVMILKKYATHILLRCKHRVKDNMKLLP